MQRLHDIPYDGRLDTSCLLDLYLSEPGSESEDLPLLLVYIHGGAWRSGDKADHAGTLLTELTETLKIPVASVNYRLSPRDPPFDSAVPSTKHPTHEEDASRAIAWLTSNETHTAYEGSRKRWRRDRIVLAGHSCGAFMAFNSSSLAQGVPKNRVQLAHDPARVAGLILLDGIFDLEALVDEYPDYRGFVEGAFNPDDIQPSFGSNSASPVDRIALDRHPYNPVQLATPILLAHSRQDSLLSLRQPQILAGKLTRAGFKSLEENYDTLKGDHNDLLDQSEVVDCIAEWFRRNQARLESVGG